MNNDVIYLSRMVMQEGLRVDRPKRGCCRSGEGDMAELSGDRETMVEIAGRRQS